MRSKAKITIFILILVIVSGIYSIIDKSNSMYDVGSDSSKYENITLKKGDSILQRFKCVEDKLNAVSMKITIDGSLDANKNDIIVNYELIDLKSRKAIVEGDTSLESLKSGKFFEINFNNVKECKNRQYDFKLSVKDITKDKGINVYYTPGVQKNTELKLKDSLVDGTLVLRTITHKFDIETFIVTLCFIIYIVIFMSWLYKLFK